MAMVCDEVQVKWSGLTRHEQTYLITLQRTRSKVVESMQCHGFTRQVADPPIANATFVHL